MAGPSPAADDRFDAADEVVRDALAALAFYRVIRANFPGTPVPNRFVAMAVVMLARGIVLAKTRFGSDICATGGDGEAARSPQPP